jgi:hypothetical protein
MASFLDSLAREDLAPATLRGYRYDLRHFLAWHATVQPDTFALDHLAAYDLIAYRQHMIAAGRPPSHDQPAARCPAPPVPMGTQHRQRWAAMSSTSLRKGTINRIMAMSDLELGLQAMLGTLPPGRP